MNVNHDPDNGQFTEKGTNGTKEKEEEKTEQKEKEEQKEQEKEEQKQEKENKQEEIKQEKQEEHKQEYREKKNKKRKIFIEYSIPDDFDNKSEEKRIEIGKDIISKFTADDLHEGHQGKHQKDHNNYIEGRSILKAEPKVLFEEAKNYNDEVKVKVKGNNVEINKFFDCKRSIGIYKDEADYKEGIPTSRIKIHYSKYGYHIVPATPSELLEDK